MLKVFVLAALASSFVSVFDFTSRLRYWMWQDSAIWAEHVAAEQGLANDENHKAILRMSRQLALTADLLTSAISSPESDLPDLDE